MVSDLIKHGCVNNKTFKIKLPNISIDIYPSFIRGYFDGDGYISLKGGSGTCGITSNYDFVTGLRNYFGKDFTNDYIDWIFNNFLRIDMSEYVATYPDFTIEGMVEDMSGMFMFDMLSWSEYKKFNEINN
jgi:hypothetical protein